MYALKNYQKDIYSEYLIQFSQISQIRLYL